MNANALSRKLQLLLVKARRRTFDAIAKGKSNCRNILNRYFIYILAENGSGDKEEQGLSIEPEVGRDG